MFSSRHFIIRETSSLVRKVPSRGVFIRSSSIRVGDSLPKSELYEDYPTNIIRMPDLVMGRNVVLFAVPGAFTPGCSKTHLPGFLKLANKMKDEGVDEIVCVSVNDPYVMGAWAAKHGTKGKIRMLADPSGAFIGAMGLGKHMATLGGFRSKRFSMIISNNKVQELNVEPDGTSLSCSLASQLYYKKYFKNDDDEKF